MIQKASPKFNLVIGRFQPFHNAHRKLIQAALEKDSHVIVLVGSYRQARNIRNPFTYDERHQMILDSFSVRECSRIHISPIRDYYYNDNLWMTEVQRVVDERSGGCNDINLFGHNRDFSSYYLSFFPQWSFNEVGSFDQDISATDIRDAYLSDTQVVLSDSVPADVVSFMRKFKRTTGYASLLEEYDFIRKYKASWATAPYPPTFVTSDSIVVKSGHVLVVKRKFMPGKRLLALPGGFVSQHETTENCAIRELKEETGINIPKDQLHKSIVDRRVYDHPLRSMRGRTISHGFYINLGSGPLPKIKAADDAAGVQWMPLHEAFANDDQFFEDHWHIINSFLFTQERR